MPIICPGGQIYIVQKGDSLFLIAKRFNTTIDQLLIANPQITNPNLILVGQEICIPGSGVLCPGGINYTIQAGDTIYSLAQRYHTTVEEIASANPGINPDNLQIGQIICIPQGPPPPVARPICRVLNPTDLFPNSKGAVFAEPDIRHVVGIVTNVPAPTVIPGGEVYKLWIIRPASAQTAVTTMQELLPGYWIGLIATNFQLEGADVIISAEAMANVTAPAGLGVAVGTI